MIGMYEVLRRGPPRAGHSCREDLGGLEEAKHANVVINITALIILPTLSRIKTLHRG